MSKNRPDDGRTQARKPLKPLPLDAETYADGQTRQRPPVDATRRNPAVSTPSQKSDQRSSALYVPWWVFPVVILIVAGLTCGLWAYVLANRGDTVGALGPTPTPIFVVITPTPTLEGAGPAEQITQPEGEDTVAPTVTPSPPAVAEPTATPPNAPLEIGSTIEVFDTGGTGLTFRVGPGVDYGYVFVGNDGDRFVIEDGPREADGFVWWSLRDPNDANRFGWAAEAWLRRVEP